MNSTTVLCSISILGPNGSFELPHGGYFVSRWHLMVFRRSSQEEPKILMMVIPVQNQPIFANGVIDDFRLALAHRKRDILPALSRA